MQLALNKNKTFLILIFVFFLTSCKISNILYQGDASFNRGNIIQSINIYLLAFKVDSTNYEVNLALGNAYMRINNYENSIRHYKKALSKKPNDVDILLNLGYNKLNNKDFSGAIEMYNRVISFEPKNYIAYLNSGAAFNYLRSYDNALLQLNKAMIFAPQDSTNYIMTEIAKSFLALGRIEEASNIFDLKLKNYPNDPTVYYEKGDFLIDFKDSLYSPYFQKSIELIMKENVKDVNYYNELAWCNARLGNFDEALSLINKALDDDSTDSESLDTKGYVMFKKGNYTEALELYQKSIVLSNFPSSVHCFHLAMVLLKLHRVEEACQNFAEGYSEGAFYASTYIKKFCK